MNILLPASVEHIGHKSRGCHRSGGINDIGHNSRETRRHGIGDDSSRCGPGKDFNLPRSVQYHVAKGKSVSGFEGGSASTAEVLHSVSSLLDEVKDLVKLGCKQVERGENATVRPQIVPVPMVFKSETRK